MPLWGSTWGSLWGSGEVASDLATLRTDRFAHVAYLLVIEGLPYMFVTDHSDSRELEGSGGGSWIGRYENEAGLPYTRTVLGGLKLPGQFKCQPDLDLNTGMFRTSLVSLEIADHTGVLPTLFAEEGKEAYRLGQRIAPGTSDVTTVVARTTSFNAPGTGPNDAEWTAAGVCYIDTETLGPNGERRWWPCMPDQDDGGQGVTWVGMEHAAWQDPDDNDNQEEPLNGPPRVRVSFDPLVFEGRKAALYRIYRDVNVDADDASAWPHWGDQHEAGNLVWWGTLRDSGEITGGGDGWKLSFFGQDSWLRRQLGTKVHNQWMPITKSTLSLEPHEQYVAVEYATSASGSIFVYQSFSFTDVLSDTYSDPNDLFTAVQTTLHNIRDGSGSHDYDEGGATTYFSDAGHTFRFLRDVVEIKASSGSVPATEIRVHVSMHEKVWRWLGWDPALQAVPPGNSSEVGFGPERVFAAYMPAGALVSAVAPGLGATTPNSPADGYWQLRFNTKTRDGDPDVDFSTDNVKQYVPAYVDKEIVVLGQQDNATFSVSPASAGYIPDDPLAPLDSEDITSGNAAESSRYFLMRGTRIEGLPFGGSVFDENGNLVEEVEAEPFYQVALVSWNNAGSYGAVDELSLGGPAFRITRWMNPRTFGYDFDKIAGSAEWTAFTTGEGKIECLPINAYVYFWSEDAEPAWPLFKMLLISTGTASNSGTIPSPTYAVGDNTVTEANAAWSAADDRAAADMSLGIPNELVASNSDLISQFGAVDGPAEGFNLVRYAYGPEGYPSYDMLQSLLQPRGLHLTLREGRYGVQLWTLDPNDVEATIEESDLRGTPGKPASVRPRQTMRATGQIDGVVMNARRPIDDVGDEYTTARELRQLSKDPGAHLRKGDRIVTIDEHGYTQDGSWRLFWAYDLPEFFARRHFMVQNLRVSREVGQDLYVGSRVRLTNPWVVDTAGNVGVTGAFAIVTGIALDTKDEVYTISCLVYAGQFGGGPRVFMPIGKISSISGSAVTLESDFLGHGEGADAAGFAAASWMTGGAATVKILSWDRNTWTLGSATQTVSSVSSNTVTLSGAFSSTPNEYHDRYLVMTDYDDQAASSWPLAHGLVTGLATGEFGSGSTTNTKYEDKD